MKANIIKKVALDNIPSGSGVEIIDGIIYIVGDDSPFLYCLDHSLKLLNRVELFKSDDFGSGRIAKDIKLDFECLTRIDIHNNPHLLIMGSGSKENRDKGYLVKLPTRFNKKFITQEFTFDKLYKFLGSNPEIVGNATLNLEAAAADDHYMILVNRANKAGKNAVLVFNIEEFLVYLTENPDMIPFPSIYHYELPLLDGVPCGFSGAGIFDNKLFFTASAEDTDDAVKDGEVKGSMIGYIEMQDTEFLRGSNYKPFTENMHYTVIEYEGKTYTGKVESVAIHEKDGDQYVAIAVTDDDKGGSELLLLEIEL